MYDVIIIGAGVAGSASARELSRYQAKICVLEKEEDVCCGTSKANSAIVHAGYDAAEGSLMAKLNVRGNEMMEQLSKDLDFPFKRNGSLVVCLHEDEMPGLEALYKRGIANGVPGRGWETYVRNFGDSLRSPHGGSAGRWCGSRQQLSQDAADGDGADFCGACRDGKLERLS